jgi:hypothetical protein
MFNSHVKLPEGNGDEWWFMALFEVITVFFTNGKHIISRIHRGELVYVYNVGPPSDVNDGL